MSNNDRNRDGNTSSGLILSWPKYISFFLLFLLTTTLELYAETAVVASVVAGPRELGHVVSAFMLMRGADDLSPEE